MRVVVIMAGGSGERFWPLSRRGRPKQLLPLTEDRSMLAGTAARAEAIVGAENVYVVAGPALTPGIRADLENLPRENLLTEPEGKNTAPCLAFAAAVIAERHGPETSMGVFTADHLIRDSKAFGQNVDLAFECAEQRGRLTTIGIRPTHPNTGFGYLETGSTLLEDERGVSHRVESFREKPDAETARRYVESGRFLWNSGMFFWRIDTLMAAFEEHAPELATGAREIAAAVGGPDSENVTRNIFARWPSVSIDYAVMEKANNVAAVASRFEWDDVGTWSALSRIHPLDKDGNLLVGQCATLDTKNCVIYSRPLDSAGDDQPASGAPETLVAALGVEDLVIVASGSAVLVCRRDREQGIKQMLEALREQGLDHYL